MEGTLSKDTLGKFKATTDEASRVKLLYYKAVKFPISVTNNNGKNLDTAQREKGLGNLFFARKDYDNALSSYNHGILTCPQDSAPARELLTILISNRSATYFELNEFKRVLNDIDYLTEIGNYPAHLQYKVWLRKAKCYAAYKNETLATEAYNEAIDSLKHSTLDEASLEAKRKEIQNSWQKKVFTPAKQEIVPAVNPEIFTGGRKYIAAHPKVAIEQDTIQGRYARALEDIAIGTIIVEENPHCSVVDSSHAKINCQFCLVSVDQPIACPSCAHVVFCCTNCERLANRSYHRVECSIQEEIFASGASVNCSMALRIITQKPFSYFKDKKTVLQDYLKDDCKKSVRKKKIYRFDDYDNVFFLCRNESLRKKEDLIHYSCMSIFLLRLLKHGKYFPFETKDDVLTDDELFIGSLILRHLQLLQFNAHEIAELKNTDRLGSPIGFEANYENTTVGAGVYPTLALFNHSCDPSIVRYNVKNKIVARSIKPIKAGDIIYENYGPLYTATPIEERRAQLKANYWFDCQCTPCVELWPMFNNMNNQEMKIPCQTEGCSHVFRVRMDDSPIMKCKQCHIATTIFSNLEGLSVLASTFPAAESFYNEGNLEKAMEIFIAGLNILFKYTQPPHADIVKVQQRIRTCMIHAGNKSCKYKAIF